MARIHGLLYATLCHFPGMEEGLPSRERSMAEGTVGIVRDGVCLCPCELFASLLYLLSLVLMLLLFIFLSYCCFQ